jgi:cytochrome c biogenesis protein CcmG, thiol:disulfide interchange protein DsbE
LARTAPPRPSKTPPRSGGAIPIWAIAIAVVALCAAVAVAVVLIAGAGDDNDGNADAGSDGGLVEETAPPVEVQGEPLPPFESASGDPAAGQPFPTLSGVSLDDTAMTVPQAGRPTLVLYLAHWCPHCQREVPVVQQWLDDGGLPDGVDLVGVATGIDPSRPNYPSSAWLEDEGWMPETLVDPDDSAATAAGLTAYPFFVAVDGDGRVVSRASGELTTDELDSLVEELTTTLPS